MDSKELLDFITEVEATATEMRLLVEGAIILLDEAWPSFSHPKTYKQRQATQCLDAVSLALDDLRDLLRSMQEGFIELPEELAT